MLDGIDIYLVDDEKNILDALTWLLENEGANIFSFSSPACFLSEVNPIKHGVAILDINMPEMDGITLLRQLNKINTQLGVIFLTGHADVNLTKQAFKLNAYDLLQKPINAEELIESILEVYGKCNIKKSSNLEEQNIINKFNTLTPREKSLIPLIIQGVPNKIIADKLHISLRTTEIHRSNLFKKMDVSCSAQLAYYGKSLMVLLNQPAHKS
ncbi:response regulator transcription factor [Photobacterium sp.]|uniref:response regulator transcription factor n=1 Tax=Photobacterium sp. TaxID=660 RepID=UPI00299CEED9|nr:response regulator [Photobacterium sp.]MDX1302666.1 response regulator [Photobacterium sp.]